MRISCRIVSLAALLAAPALVACDKEESHDTKADSATGSDTEDGSGTADGSSSEPTGTEGSSVSEGTDTEGGSATEGTGTGEATEGSTTGTVEAVCDAANYGVARPCSEGSQFCTLKGGTYDWGVCVAAPVCVPGTSDEELCTTCELTEEGVPYQDAGNCETSTPLVLSFEGSAVQYASAGHRFDLGPECAATDWPLATTPWLALDRDRSGTIDGGHELFGSATRLRTGEVADNGFTALKELDSDGDGRLTAADPGFAALMVWSDGDGDRRSSGLELQPVAAFGLVAIELGYANDRRCDLRGNCEIERASFTYQDALGRTRSGEVVDVHLSCQ